MSERTDARLDGLLSRLLDLSRSGAGGVRLLRDFLEFAERGQGAQAPVDPLDAASQHAGRPGAATSAG